MIPAASGPVNNGLGAPSVGEAGGVNDMPSLNSKDSSTRPMVLKTIGERFDQIYIGHLPKEMTDDLVKRLLSECGQVVKISRSRNPKTDELASFCFVEFDNIESVWRVLHLIDGLQVSQNTLNVRCPQKARETMDRWHNNRSYHLYKVHPEWSQDRIDREFLQAEQPLKDKLVLVVKEIEELMSRAKIEKEQEDKARSIRLEAMRARLNDRKHDQEQQVKRSRTASTPSDKKSNDSSSLPSELVARQKHRVETHQRKKQDFLKHLEEAKQNWPKTLDMLRKKAERRQEDILYRWSKAIPSSREAWNQLKADLEGFNAIHTVSYACSNGTSPLYDLEPRLASEASRLSVNSHDIPTARYWIHKVNNARELMRQAEAEDEAAIFDARPALSPQEEQELRGIREHIAKIDAEEAEKRAKTVDIDWERLAKDSVFVNGSLRDWLVQKTTEFVGAEDAEDMAEYILDQFPPRASTPPTQTGLSAEMREFLDVETEDFVNALWAQIKSF